MKVTPRMIEMALRSDSSFEILSILLPYLEGDINDYVPWVPINNNPNCKKRLQLLIEYGLKLDGSGPANDSMMKDAVETRDLELVNMLRSIGAKVPLGLVNLGNVGRKKQYGPVADPEDGNQDFYAQINRYSMEDNNL